ncbi:MAG: DUF1800 domain-containing protein [Candidatus Eremiobacteraeota bacterium]|nr:DUF1800 domain-containing protein [Candidatus Eremiobacteraeota bacterium]
MTGSLDTSTDPQVGFRPPGTLDLASALQRYTGPWGARQAAHLARRTGFGPTPQEVRNLTALRAEAAVNSILHPSASDVDLPLYPDAAMLYDRKTRYQTAQMWWLDRMLRTKNPFAEKMALFWHGHFATSMRKVPPALLVRQIRLFRSIGLGDFRSLLLAVSQDPAMLIWLDNRYNYKAHPNENYAREVMELFALGLGNYTEDDVKSAARAFTGWTLDRDQNFVFRPRLHDDGEKTFLGRTGNFTGEDIIGIIVSQPISQRFIARKLLEFFLYSDPESELTEQLASVYALSGYDIAKTMGTLLRSNVFYSTRAYRSIPKSPVEFMLGLLRYFGAQRIPGGAPSTIGRMGQEILAPPSVKGWEGGPTWINTSTLLARFNAVNAFAQNRKPAEQLITPVQIVQAAGGMDASRVLQYIASSAVQDDLTSATRRTLMDYLQATHAPNPTPFGPENFEERIRGALALVLNSPSNQLN